MRDLQPKLRVWASPKHYLIGGALQGSPPPQMLCWRNSFTCVEDDEIPAYAALEQLWTYPQHPGEHL